MIYRPGDRCRCKQLDGAAKECEVLRGPLPPVSVSASAFSNRDQGAPLDMCTPPYRYEIRYEDGGVEIVGEPRLGGSGDAPDTWR